MTVADRIRNRRIELGMSQDELAERAGYKDKTSISKLEHLGDGVTMKQAQRLSDPLDVTVAYLMGWEGTATELPPMQVPEPVPEPGYVSTADIPKAINLYEKYKSATPEVRAAIELLLKGSQSES